MMAPAAAPRPAVCFSHGQESGPWGTKIRVLARYAREAGFAVESLDYQGMAPESRVERLVEWCATQSCPPVLVGSSLGAHVALAAAARLPVAGVFAIAAAVYMPGHEARTPPPPTCPLVMVHGWRDDVVPVELAIRYARESGQTLHLVDGDHRLTANLDDLRQLFGLFLQRMWGSPVAPTHSI